MTWTLIVLVSIGGFSKGEANGMTSVPGFASRAQCEAAAQAVRSTFSEGTKKAQAVCVEQGGATP